MSSNVPAPGETSLNVLLASLDPVLNPETYVFITLADPTSLPSTLFVQSTFREKEGLSVISTQSSAEEHDIEYSFPSRMITLNVHSSLEAVGFLAVITRKLAERQMGVNPVSGYFHDHLFIAVGKDGDALQALDAIRESAKKELSK